MQRPTSPTSSDAQYTIVERILRLGADVKPGEGLKVLALCFILFMLMFTAYILKPVREELILVQQGSEWRSYATAFQALLLLGLVPLYGFFSRRYASRSFMMAVIGFFVGSFLLFLAASYSGAAIGILFYVWLGAFGVLSVSQFWAYASDQLTEEDGKRLFGLIAFGASMGALIGALTAKALPPELDSRLLLAAGACTLLISQVPVLLARNRSQRSVTKAAAPRSMLNAFRLIRQNRYLQLIAIFVLLFSWTNALGEYLVSLLVERNYQNDLESGSVALSQSAYIKQFYSNYFLAVNIGSTMLQFFVVSRFINGLGVKISLLIVPVFIFLGYSLVLFVGVLLLFKIIKVIENSLDYSLMNTVKQVLYIPTSREERYEARALIETLGVRCGDMLQALTVFVGLNLLHIAPKGFIYFIAIVSMLVIALAIAIGNRHKQLHRPD
ncbi:MFS transporter [Neiella marina]|uniref:MFS transporter n=1 Tax=Neiella holothuriorum TaxID=2870530 RepID=A0ABS7ELW5_9GAMM|nr:MFS transporter [Neiella holothuriorum]MBW8192596.1 MFS transporter [Neiella holothuriorum]